MSSVRERLARHGLRANRKLGQNFLLDPALAARLAEQAGVGPSDAVIEIGTGLGVMTRALAVRARKVLSIEVDAGLVRALAAEDDLPAHVELRHGDALDADFAALARDLGRPVRVVGNLPYSISSPLLRRLLDARGELADWSVMVQREVGERLRGTPGTRDYGSLAVLHQLCVRIEKVRELRPGCFHPRPKVLSVFLRLHPRADSPLGPGELPWLERVVRAAFATRRKLLANALRKAELGVSRERIEAAFRELGLDRQVRAEALDPDTLLALARALESA